jgi:hypothetical protein
VRIAMWSGPRTVSTAMMRAWENRPDTVVVDEPLYSFYLSSTGLDHPGRAEVIASQPASWEAVLSSLASAPLPDGVTIAYAKHMTHHVLPMVDLAAFAGFRHAFLIRDPRALLASYARVRSTPTLEDLGLRQQVSLYEAFGGPVIDSSDLLAAQEAGLQALCAALSVPFSASMLSWPAGPRDSDGVWAPYWYDSVWKSTGFGRSSSPAAASSGATSASRDPLPPELEPLAEQCLPYYERLSAHKLAF